METKITIKNPFKAIDWKAVVKLFAWLLLVIVLIYFTIWFIQEKADAANQAVNLSNTSNGYYFNGVTVQTIKDNINNGNITSSGWNGDSNKTLINAYIAMYATYQPALINFSLMTFVSNAFSQPATDPTSAWSVRNSAVDLAYSYMFITAAIAIVALVMQVYVNIIMMAENHRIKKYQLGTKFPTSTAHFSLFKVKMWSDFITNLALVFAFFNFLSTLIVISYWLLTWTVNFVVGKIKKQKVANDDSFAQHKSELMYLIFVMIFQTVYTIVKAIFLSEWGVNLDLIFSIILPIGTITVIVGLFIKNLLSSKVSSVLSAIKSISGNVSTFRTFYYTNGIDALNDFNFVATLPPMIKGPLTDGSIDKQKALELMKQLDDAIKYVETNYTKNTKDRNFMLYTLINNITSIDQIQEMEDNASKLKTANLI